MRASAAALLVATLIGCGGRPPPPPPDPRTPLLNTLNAHGPAIELVDAHTAGTLAVEKYRLPNGLVLLYLPDHQAPVLSYQTWFRVGSRHERPGKTGIAHLFEHLMFKETKNTPEGEFDRRLERIGGRVNAATWLDWTYYYEDVPSAHLSEVVHLESDRMQHMVLNSDQLEAERDVVLNERKEYVDNDPNGKLSEVLWRAAFTAHPYGHPTIGWAEDIEGLSLEDCLAFYGTYYAPNNAVIVVTGDVDRDALLTTIVAHYGAMASQSIPPYDAVVEPRQTEPRRVEQRLPLGAERLLMGYHAPAVTDPRHAAFEVLNEVLFEGDSARVYRALVTDGELASSVGAFVPGFRDPGLYEVSVDLRPGHRAEEAEDVILDHFARVAREGISEAELTKARNKLETTFYRTLQTAQQRARALGFWEVTAGDYRHLFTAIDLLRSVTRDEVQAAAATFLAPEGRTVVLGRPTPESADPEGADDAEADVDEAAE